HQYLLTPLFLLLVTLVGFNFILINLSTLIALVNINIHDVASALYGATFVANCASNLGCHLSYLFERALQASINFKQPKVFKIFPHYVAINISFTQIKRDVVTKIVVPKIYFWKNLSEHAIAWQLNVKPIFFNSHIPVRSPFIEHSSCIINSIYELFR